MRSSAKAINFGIMYGKGAFSLSKDLGISSRRPRRSSTPIWAPFPKRKEYHGRDRGRRAAKTAMSPPCTAAAGRCRSCRQQFQRAQPQGERMAMNTPIQGTAADVIKLAMVRVYRRLQAEGLRAR